MSQKLDLVVSDLEVNSDKLAETIERWYEREAEAKWERAITWSQSIHFLAGNQWIRYSQQERRWNAIPVTEDNKHIDRPTTNHINRWVRVNLSGFTNKPNISIEANSEQPEDKTAAKISESVHLCSWEKHQKEDQYYECALWGVVTGIAIRKSFKRQSRYSADGKPMKINDSTPVSPFNIMFDGVPSRFRDIGIVMETDVCRIEDIKAEYGDKAKDIKEEKIVSTIMAMKEGLKDIVEGAQSAGALHKQGEDLKECVIKKEVYVKPSRKHPEGRMIVVASGILLYDGPSPYYYQDGRYWHPYTFVNFEKVPGSLWGMGLAQRLVPLQRRINSIDALVAYNRKTIAVPWILNPKDSGIKPGEKIGIPGQQIDYEVSTMGVKPEIVPGAALPVQIMQERDMCIRDGDMLAMAGDIRSGQNPSGVKTLGQMQILMEQSEMSRSRQVEDWEKFIEESEKLDLLNFQSCYQAPVPETYNELKKYSKDITDFDWSQFKGADLRDNCTVRVEKGSTLAKSRYVRQGLILSLAKDGFLGDFMVDPFRYKEFLGEFGLGNLFSDQNMDVIMAEKCLEMMLVGKYPPLLEQYNPDIHMMVLARYMKTPKYLELKDPIKRLFMQRFEELAKPLGQYPTVADETPPPGTGKGGGSPLGKEMTKGVEKSLQGV